VIGIRPRTRRWAAIVYRFGTGEWILSGLTARPPSRENSSLARPAGSGASDADATSLRHVALCNQQRILISSETPADCVLLVGMGSWLRFRWFWAFSKLLFFRYYPSDHKQWEALGPLARSEQDIFGRFAPSDSCLLRARHRASPFHSTRTTATPLPSRLRFSFHSDAHTSRRRLAACGTRASTRQTAATTWRTLSRLLGRDSSVRGMSERSERIGWGGAWLAVAVPGGLKGRAAVASRNDASTEANEVSEERSELQAASGVRAFSCGECC
jgi:hypothetical protein